MRNITNETQNTLQTAVATAIKTNITTTATPVTSNDNNCKTEQYQRKETRVTLTHNLKKMRDEIN